MAALCPGVQYGLSSQENFGENKDLIFVKLTDSAFRAIDEYLKNQNKFNQNPSIQFLGNEGHLSFPTEHGNNGCARFNFSISSTADMEGPGGSFECVQQCGSPSKGQLESLGAIPHKMRIHANDDVYEATKHRMTVAEENHKNKRTRVIKPNQTDIGRKVKVKQLPGKSIPTLPKKESVPSIKDNSSKSSYLSSAISSSKSNSTNSMNGNANHVISSNRPQNKSKSSTDMMSRPIKERLIHLLALRPHKKPELLERINRDGKEKNAFTTVLKQIAFMSGNTYKLYEHMWNYVNEDWPCYTEQEKQILKRRKPQNLTPPGSSDTGSSGSGQSPTSTHPGSPPPPVTAVKRPGYIEGVDGLPTKKPRISHYRKPEPPYSRSVDQRRTPTDSRDTSNMNPRSRETISNEYPTNINGYNNTNLTTVDNQSYSDDENDSVNSSRKQTCDSQNSIGYIVNRDKTIKENSICNSPNNKLISQNDYRNEKDSSFSDRIATNVRPKPEVKERDKDRTRWNKVSSITQNFTDVPRETPDSPDSQPELIHIDTNPTSNPQIHNSVELKTDFPDYLTKYTKILDTEQRRKYKADFNADYAEYRDLHAIVERVSRRFAQLEERLKQENQSSPGYKEIKKQIVRDYKENQRDIEYQKAKQRFQYLHDKLSHIKRLVLEYDKSTESQDEIRSRY